MNKEKPRVLSDEQFLEWCGSHKVIGCGGTREMKGVDRDVSVCEDCRATAQRDDTYQKMLDAFEPLIQQAEMKGWRKGNELKQKRLDIKLKMAKAREIFEEIEEEIKTAEAKQIEANNDVENPERYPNERYWQGYEHATRFIGQSLESKYMEGK